MSAGATQPFQLQSPPIPPPPESKRQKKTEPEEASQSPFSVAIGEVYSGPFDLLLDLIRKQNLDIYDIPMARITSQFLEYTRHLKAIDVDAAGDFVYTASLLIHIKSRMLLPREPTEPQGSLDVEDPRRELVERLLEHERFKSAAQMLQQKQQIEAATWTQPGMKRFLNDEGETAVEGEREIAADTTDLIRVFREVLGAPSGTAGPSHRRGHDHRRADDRLCEAPSAAGRQTGEPARPSEEHPVRARADLYVSGDVGAGTSAGDPSAPTGQLWRHFAQEDRQV